MSAKEQTLDNISFIERLKEHNACGRYLWVGLDADKNRINKLVRDGLNLKVLGYTSEADWAVAYTKLCIEATADIPAVYKLNLGPYRRYFAQSSWAVREVIKNVKKISKGSLVMVDAKVNDIGESLQGYLEEIFEFFKADAVTVNPLMGDKGSLDRAFAYKDKGIFVLAKTSNIGGGEIQNITVDKGAAFFAARLLDKDRESVYMQIARRASSVWNYNGNIGVVAGATYPFEAGIIREIVGREIPILMPGISKRQGGNLRESIKEALRKDQVGIIGTNEDILYAWPEENERVEEAMRRSALTVHRKIRRIQNELARR